ncbi:MAG TPA: glycosyltransferase family 87 protein [Ktedonobacterales bacterium]|nr:glycosyltransferase family 87 protein [Ktedonobacterales bacterium]
MFDTEKRVAVRLPSGASDTHEGEAPGETARSWTAAELMAGGLLVAACGSLWHFLGAILRPDALENVSGQFGQDILPTYQAARQILLGHGPAMYDPAVVHGYTYSPVFAWLFTPLALLPWPTAIAIWYPLSWVWVWAAVVMLARIFTEVLPAQLRALRIAGMPLIPVLAAAWIGIPPSVQAALEFGQVDYLNLALLAGAFLCLLRRRDGLAGVLIVLAAMLKITPIGMLAVFVLFRRWRALTFGLLTLVVCVGVTSLDPRVGLGAWLLMPQGVNANFDFIFILYSNESLAGVFAQLATLVHRHLTPHLAEYAGFAIAAPLFAGALAFGLRREMRESADWIVAAAAGLGALLLASPLNWDHSYLVAAAPATILLARAATRWLATHHIGWLEIVGLLSAAILASWPMTAGLKLLQADPLGMRLAGVALIGARPLALLLVVCLLLWELWRSQQPLSGRSDKARVNPLSDWVAEPD